MSDKIKRTEFVKYLQGDLMKDKLAGVVRLIHHEMVPVDFRINHRFDTDPHIKL